MRDQTIQITVEANAIFVDVELSTSTNDPITLSKELTDPLAVMEMVASFLRLKDK